MKKRLLVFSFCLLPSAFYAQAQPPATEVFLAPLVWTNSSVTVGPPVNISNNPGYDNQPSFLPDSSAVIFASNRDTVANQNDIYKYDIATKQLVQLTKTAENEYSPLVSTDGRSILTVHGAEQSIFRYDMDGGNPRLAYQHGAAKIGYHVWTTPTEFAAFILGTGSSPATLQVIDTTTGNGVTIESNIGRSLLRRVGHNTISFVSKSDPQKWAIKEFDITTKAVTTITDTVPRSEDLTWLPDGRIVMASGSTLFIWQTGATGWAELADLTGAGIKRITRLSASRDGKHLAIVGEL
jgi:dipeptidyl aminopeptidase/acylaminoacyl peptidase